MNFDFSNLGENIARLRRQTGMTQESLAERLGVTSAAVSKWERQLSCPDIALLPEVAAVFGVTIDDLFGKETNDRLTIEGLPWEDDGVVRVVVFEGNKLCINEIYECPGKDDVVLLVHHEDGKYTRPVVRRAKNTSKTPPE